MHWRVHDLAPSRGLDSPRRGSRRPSALACVVHAVALGLIAGTAGCADGEGDDANDDGPRCAEIDVTSCTPSYPAEFDRVMSETLVPRCSVPGGACHAEADAAGAAGGLLVTDDADAVHAILTDEGRTEPFVTPGDPLCSPMMERIDTEDSARLMPPASPLDEGVRCSIAQWIDGGAAR